MHSNQFVNEFKFISYVSFISGIYVPTLQILPNRFTAFNSIVMIAYCSLSGLCSLLNIGDLILEAKKKSETPNCDPLEILYLASNVIACTWIMQIKYYWLFDRTSIGGLISFWNNLPQMELWSARRVELIQIERKNCNRKTWLLLLFFVAPWFFNIPRSLYNGVLMTPSYFGAGHDHMDANANLFLIIFQALAYFFQLFCYSMNSSLYWVFLGLVKVELDYLQHFINNTVQHSHISDIQHPTGRMETDEIVIHRLQLMATYYDRICQLVKRIEEAYIPLIVLEYVSLTTSLCIVGYSTIAGILNMHTIIFSAISLASFLAITMISCSIGDEIQDKGLEVFHMVFHWDWASRCLQVQRMLITIIMMTRKPIVISATARLFPLNSRAFRQMLLLQYKFFRFIADMQNRQ